MQNEEQDKPRRAKVCWPPLIQLQREGQGELIVAGVDGDGPILPFIPFRFPALPLSLHCWLTGLGGEFRRRHDRCLVALLVLHYGDERWVRPIIPAQICGADGAAWTLDLGEQVLGSHHCIGGSFQVRTAVDVMDAVQTVPQLDGLHIVQTLRGQVSMAYCFLHAEGQTSVLSLEQAMEDDWAAAFAAAAARMTFE